MTSILSRLSPYIAAALASALSVANTDLSKFENFILAFGPTAVAALFNRIRAALGKL